MIEEELKEFLDDYSKVIFLGIGNRLKTDDGAGSKIIDKLKDLQSNSLIFIDGETVPENFTGKIRKENPSHLIIIDACIMKEEPGTVKVVNQENFVNIGISTHSMSLSFFVKYLQTDLDFKVLFIGIEPESMDYSEDLSEAVKNSLDELTDIIRGIL